MSGTFASFNTALSGLRYQQTVMEMASTNVANATTEGYVRRRVVGETTGASATPAMWSRSDEIGSGVRATGVNRMVDPLLDGRVRAEHGKQAWLDYQTGVLARVETGIAEPSDTGVAAAFSGFRSALHDLANAPDSEAARGQVLGAAETVSDAIRLQAHQLDEESAAQRTTLLTTVDEVNQVGSDLAATNHSIAVARLSGADDSTLLDTRDRLALRLSELTGATATVRSDGGMDVAVNGVPLVQGQSAGQLRIATGVTAPGGADGNPVTFAVDPSGTTVAGPIGGRAGAVADLLDTVLPAYAAGLATIAQDFADQLNAQHATGYDTAGAPGTALFDYDPADPAGTLRVAITDPAKVAASALAGGVRDATNASTMADAITVEDDYQRLVSGFGTSVASLRRLTANQQALTSQVDASREQLAGVSLDEETVNMVAAQRAYEAAARVMTTLDSVLDTLVNRTGLVR